MPGMKRDMGGAAGVLAGTYLSFLSCVYSLIDIAEKPTD
jgi:hypothetical protein